MCHPFRSLIIFPKFISWLPNISLMMFGFVNLCTLSLLVVVGMVVLGEQLNNESNNIEDIDVDINKVENSLNEVQNLLKLIEQDPEQNKKFANLGKHVALIREQLRTIQDEYHMNRDIDQFNNRLGHWSEQFRSIGGRLKRQIQKIE